MLNSLLYQSSALDSSTPEELLADLVDSVKQAAVREPRDDRVLQKLREMLVTLLDERLSLYKGRSANQTIRMRGYILAAFEHVGLPETGIPFVLEELESGRDAYLVAAAAKAIRGISVPTAQLVPFMFSAVENIKLADDAITFEQYKPSWPLSRYTTALAELFQTLGWLGASVPGARQSILAGMEVLLGEKQSKLSLQAKLDIKQAAEQIVTAQKAQAEQEAQKAHQAQNGQASQTTEVCEHCCAEDDEEATLRAPRYESLSLFSQQQMRRIAGGRAGAPGLAAIDLQDQAGTILKYDQFFLGKPTVLTFFYTRCNNPNKCSLTIAKLGQLQKALAEQGFSEQVRTAAISYDPEFDLPSRLWSYGVNRGFSFGDNHRMFRTLSGFHDLQHKFGLSVNFTGTTVNRHALELFILTPEGKVSAEFTRLQWDVEYVLHRLIAELKAPEQSL